MWKEKTMKRSLLLLSPFVLGLACGTQNTQFETDHLALNDQSITAILTVVNDPQVSFEMLDIDIGLDRRAATNIVDYRNGGDDIASTADDRQFQTIQELDSVSYVGNSPLSALLNYALTNYQAATPSAPAARSRYSYSQSVFDRIVNEFDITDPDNLLVRAEAFDNGNRYLNRSELTQAAQDIQRDEAFIRGYRYSNSVVDRLMGECTLRDRLALLAHGVRHNLDKNKYLKTSELNAAKNALANAGPEIGVISDIDRTLLPHSGSLYSYLDPFAGAVTLLDELEHGQGGKSGDTYYVTTRNPSVLGEVPEWIRSSGFPTGPIDTGIAPQPWISQPEKVSDISNILDANPNTVFVLFGDSNHRDPEAYADVMRLYPGRIAAVFIHRVNTIRAGRTDQMIVYEEIHENAVSLLRAGILSEASTRRVLEAAQAEGAALSNNQIDDLIRSNALTE
jgi:hypothetical protein